MSCPLPLPTVLHGKCGFLKPWLWGQRSAGGKSADCVTAPRCGWRRPWLQSRCAQNAAWLAADATHSIFRQGFFYLETFILLLFLSSTTGQKWKHHFSTSLIRYNAASTITAWNEEVPQRKKDGVFMSSPTYFSGSRCAVPPHFPVSVLSRVMSFGIGNRCVCEMCRSLLYPRPSRTSPSPCQRFMAKAMEEGEQRKHRGN